MEAIATGRPAVLYDSARERAVLSDAASIWRYRRLLWVLVGRNIRTLYKRSVLGIWWAVLNPLLMMCVLWVVFSQVFQLAIPGVPFVVYLLSGLVIALLLEQVVTEVSASLVHNAAVLTKVYAPPAVFALAAALAAGVNFLFTLIPLVGIQLATGMSVPWTALLAIVPAIALLVFATGIGLMLAPLAARFEDTLHVTRFVLLIVFYLTPIMYPVTILPERFRALLDANPQYHFVTLFRDLMYGGRLGQWTEYALVLGLGVGTLALGSWMFSRGWRQAIVRL